MVIAKVGQDGRVAVYNDRGSVDIVVDVIGWFAAGSAFNALTPGSGARHPTGNVSRRRCRKGGADRGPRWCAAIRGRWGGTERHGHRSERPVVSHGLADGRRQADVVEPQLRRRPDGAEHGHRQARERRKDLAVQSDAER